MPSKYNGMRDLAPGESATVAAHLRRARSGPPMSSGHRLGRPALPNATDSGCITAIDARPTTPPALEVTKQGPTRHYVGEIAKFRIVIKNTGESPVTNLGSRRPLRRRVRAAVHRPRAGNPGQRRFRMEDSAARKGRAARDQRAVCLRVAGRAARAAVVTVTADGDVRYAEEKCVEIMLPLAATPPSTTGGIAPPPPLPSEDLKLTLRTSANPGPRRRTR